MTDPNIRSSSFRFGRPGNGGRTFRQTVVVPALRISFIYFLFSAFWIFGSDVLVERMSSPSDWALLQTLKGWLFVTITAGLLFVVVYRDLKALHREQVQTRGATRRALEVIDSSPIGIAILDCDGRVTRWNRAATQILGWAEDDVLGKPASAFAGEPGTAELLLPCVPGGPLPDGTRVTRFRAKDGHSVDVDVRVRRVQSVEGPECGATVLFDDITDRKHVEDALRESEERLRRVVSNAPYPMMLLAEDGEILIVNQSWSRITGYGQSDLSDIGAWVQKAYRSDHQKVLDGISHLFELHEPVDEGEFEIYTRSGERRIWNFSSSPMGRLPDGRRLVVSVASDITERRNAEDALRRSEERLERAQRMASLGNWEVNVLTGEAVWSDEAYRILGLDPATIRACMDNFLRVVPAEDIPSIRAAVEESERTGEPYNVIHRIMRPDGTVRHVKENGVPTRDEHGRLIYIIGTIQDITDYKLLEQQLHHAQRMEAVGRLAGGVAHDFNNLLTVVNGYSQLLLQRTPPGTAGRTQLEEIHKAGLRAAQLTRQLLAFSRKQVMNPQPLNLNAALESIRGMLKRLIPENIELTLELAEQLPQVRVDSGQIEQVVMNLTVNAVDAMPNGGRLTLVTRQQLVPSAGMPCAGGVVPPGHYTVLAVRDHGIGMDEQTMQRIFEPFFTTKDVGKGTGLGLATVFGIVTQSDGYLQVDSQVNHGSEFRILLPALEPAHEAAKPEAPQWTPSRQSGTILLVEDEDVVRGFTANLLEQAGYHVIQQRNGLEALEYLENPARSIAPDLLLTDMVMPKLSGMELARRIVHRWPNIPVVFMSGYADMGAAAEAGPVAVGDHLLQKPFSPEELLRKVESVLQHST